MGQLPTAEGDDFLGSALSTCFQRDKSLGALAPFFVWDRDDGTFEYCLVASDDLLDFDGRDILAARDNDVLLSVAQFDIAVGVPDGQIAGVKEAVPEGFRIRSADPAGTRGI